METILIFKKFVKMKNKMSYFVLMNHLNYQLIIIIKDSYYLI